MSEVLHAVMKVRGTMNEIAAASNEQSRGIEHLSQAIAQMDPVTQQNAALVEEDAAASQSLDDQGTPSTEAVSFFPARDALMNMSRSRCAQDPNASSVKQEQVRRTHSLVALIEHNA